MNAKKSYAVVIFILGVLVIGGVLGLRVAYSDDSVTVTARVGSMNMPPIVLGVNPSASPIVMKAGTMQNISIRVQDVDSSSVDFTVSVPTGSVSPMNGSMTNATALAAGQASLDFTYFSPSTKPVVQPNITITISDGINAPIVKSIKLYIYQ